MPKLALTNRLLEISALFFSLSEFFIWKKEKLDFGDKRFFSVGGIDIATVCVCVLLRGRGREKKESVCVSVCV